MDLVVEYNKDDFLYYTTTTEDNEELTPIIPGSNNKSVDCNTNPTDLAKELCNNKKLADQLLNRTELHSGSDEMYANTISKHNSERLTTFNLAMGIMVGIIAILKFRT